MIGETINNRYNILSLLGEGGMGEVYLAIDQHAAHQVAVKILARQLSTNPESLERFKREAETLRQLDHPNIVKFVDAFNYAGQYVIVMEYVPGGSLHDLLKQGPLPIDRAHRIAVELCDALIRSHHLNIIHRDLKPDNVLLDKDGKPKLADFGVARLEEGTRMTRTGTQVGTPYYMAPEAWGGKPLDAQADIWSLGIMLFEMLAGQVPFNGDTPLAVMSQVSTAPLPNIKKLRGDIPAGLIQIIKRMLARDKKRRYATMREVAVDLERERQKKTAKPGSTSYTSERGKSVSTLRPKTAVFLVGGVVILAIAGGFPYISGLLAGNREGGNTPTALSTSTFDSSENIPTVAETSTLAPVPTATSTAIGGGDGKIAFVSDRDGKGEIYVMNLDENNPIQLTNNTEGNLNLAISPDGRKIAFGAFTEVDSELHIMNADGSNPTVLTNTPGIYYGVPIWSPDSRKILFDYYYVYGCCQRRNTIHLMNADGSNEIDLTNITNQTYGPAWSPDGEKIAFGVGINGNDEIYLINVDGSNLINLTNHPANDGGPVWSPDGKKIAFLSDRDGNNEIYIMDSNGSSPVNLTNSNAEDTNPVWSPDGTKIAFVSHRDGNDEIYVMSVDGTDLLNVTNHLAADTNPVWSPDGTKIAFVSERDRNEEIYIVDADGSNLFNLTNNNGSDSFPVWLP